MLTDDRAYRRRDGLITRQVGAETVVYDLATDRVTHLDESVATLWDALDGSTSLSRLAAATSMSMEAAGSAVVRLADAGLVEQTGLSRRALLARAGAVAWTVPLVSIVAPTAAYAQSGVVPPEPEVGTITHTCRGSHTQTFLIPLSGLPPNTDVTLTYSISPGDDYTETKTTDANGNVTFSQTYPSTGQPVRARTVTVTQVSYLLGPAGPEETVEFDPPVTYTGNCP